MAVHGRRGIWQSACMLDIGSGEFNVVDRNGQLWYRAPNCADKKCFLLVGVMFGMWHCSRPNFGITIKVYF